MPCRPSVARVNSAAASLELPVQWSRVLQLADRRQASQVSSPSGQPVWRVYAVQGGEGALPTVADTASLEVCLAAALLGHNVEVSIVEGFRESDMSVLQGKTHWALEEGWTLLRRSPSQLWLDFQPHVVGSRRDTELACWPKVWQFAQQLRKGSGSRAAESLGAMDATWCHKRSRWLISNRHRALAALLLSTPLECIVSLPQKTGDNKAFWPGPASKTRLKRVSRAAEALNSLACSGKPASVSAEALHRAIGLCEEALQKAPKESSEAGVTWEAVGVLRALEARTERETSRS